jgi:dihydrofolate reductase
MRKIIVDVSVSLDGFMAGPNVSAAYPMGERGDQLHRWLFGDRPNDIDSAIVKRLFAGIGAVVLGRRTFDIGFDEWDQQTPFPAPTFVVTHRVKDPISTSSGTFTFFAEGAAAAIEQARAAAGEKNVAVMGGELTQELLRLGLIDELHIHMIPLLLGDGLRLFDNLDGKQTMLELVETTPSAEVTHLVYRLPK